MAPDKHSKVFVTSHLFSRILSSETRRELKQLISLSWLPILTNVLHNTLFTISLLFAGRLGEQELAATVLSTSFIGVTGTFLGSGLITALEVLCTKAFRNRSYRLVGITFQRGVWFLGISVLFVWAIWTNAELLLLIIKQKREIVRFLSWFSSFCLLSVVNSNTCVLVRIHAQLASRSLRAFRPIRIKENILKSQWEPKVKTTKLPKALENFVLVLHLIGWESGASILNQSRREVEKNATPDCFRHSSQNCSISNYRLIIGKLTHIFSDTSRPLFRW